MKHAARNSLHTLFVEHQVVWRVYTKRDNIYIYTLYIQHVSTNLKFVAEDFLL